MTDEDKIAALTGKIEREMKFTRSLVLLCTAAILGIIFLNIKLMIDEIPGLVFQKSMENMNVAWAQWRLLEKSGGTTPSVK